MLPFRGVGQGPMDGRTRPVSGAREGEAASVSAAEDYTLGVEEEYQIIDPETLGLSPSGEAVVRPAQQALGEEHVAPELRTSQVEAMTPICRTPAEVRAELLRLRRGVIRAAAVEGRWVAPASSPTF